MLYNMEGEYNSYHRISWVGRDIWSPSGPTLLQWTSSAPLGAQSPVQPDSECIQGRDIHQPSGQPVPVPHHPWHKKFPPDIQPKLPVLKVIWTSRFDIMVNGCQVEWKFEHLPGIVARKLLCFSCSYLWWKFCIIQPSSSHFKPQAGSLGYLH